MLKRHAIGIAACLALLGQQGAALAQVYDSTTNAVMSGCRDFLEPTARHNNPSLQSACGAIVHTIAYFGETHFGFCPPTMRLDQAVRVVVVYIDQEPLRIHEQFFDLALEAMQQAWPCSR